MRGKRIDNYILEKELGRGVCGLVFKAIDVTTKEPYAVKIIEKQKVKENNLERFLETEVKIMYEIDHPNIMRLVKYLESVNNYYLVMPYCNQGDLSKYLSLKPGNCLAESEAVRLLKQI